MPICWPWFGPRADHGQHGFARISLWRTVSKGTDHVTLELAENDVDEALLAGFKGFIVSYTVKIGEGNSLELTMTVKNTSSNTPLPAMTAALHSYFNVQSADSVEVRLNAKDLEYLDQLTGQRRVNASGVVSAFGSEEVDMVVYDVPSSIDIVDSKAGKLVTIQSQGFHDAVLWNPFKDKSRAMADFGDEEWRGMVCCESAAVGKPVIVKPDSQWTGSVTLDVPMCV